MRTLLITWLLLGLLGWASAQPGLPPATAACWPQQLAYPRGQAAYARCWPTLAATSGTLGPKRRADDGQVPEGFYTIDRFHPLSAYHLALGLDYPTADDLLATGLADPGGDIFLPGSHVTVGCLPLTDAGIDEVYLLAVAARAAGQASLAVHIFPFPLVESELRQRAASPHAAFWRGLVPGYAYFEAHHCPQ